MANKIKKFIQAELSEQSSKIIVWKYLFFILISKFIIKSSKKEWQTEKKWPKEVRCIRKFLIDNDEIEDLKTLEKIKKITSKIQPDSISIKLSAIVDVGIGKNKKERETISLSEKIKQIEEFLYETLNLSHFTNKRFHIYVDQVDDMWTNDEASNQAVIGLLLAAHHINTKFGSVKCIIFLRTDIYQVLEFHDKDKFHGAELEIRWDEQSLIDLFYERILQVLKQDNEILEKENISKLIFPGEINGISTLNYIISRTLFRPRELIQFCNISLDIAKKNKHHQIEPSDVQEAEETYSKWKLNDLAREYKTNYPFLNDLLVVFGKHLGFTTPEFDRAQFSDKYSIIRTKLEERCDELSGFTTEIVLAILYNIGFIGVVRSGSVTYKYSDSNTISSLDNQFVVHPAFWNALGIKLLKKLKEAKTSSAGVTRNSEPVASENQKTTKKEKTKSSKGGKKKSTQIIAGTDEVKTKTETNVLYRLAVELGLTASHIGELKLKIGKASLIRTTAYLRQAERILKQVVSEMRRELEFSVYNHNQKKEIRNFITHQKEIPKACKLIEMSITQLEQLLLKETYELW